MEEAGAPTPPHHSKRVVIYRCRCGENLRLVEVLEFGGSRFHLACLRCGFASKAVAGAVTPENIWTIPDVIFVRADYLDGIEYEIARIVSNARRR